MATQEIERVPRGQGTHGHRSKAEIEAEALEVLRLKVLGWSDVAIGEHLNMARNTVSARLKHAIATHGEKTVAEYREIAQQRYEAGMAKLTPLIDAGSLDALRLWFDATAKWSKLVGAEAPVQVAMEVTQVTEQEKALKDMLAQARQDEKARESVLIEGEVVDV